VATKLINPRVEEERIGAFLAALARRGAAERLATYRSGGFTREECMLWAAYHHEEPPLVNGECECIALGLADLD
jgi:hypothetical protein